MGRRSSVIKWYHLHKSLKLLLLIWAFSSVALGLDSDQAALLEFKASVSDPAGVLSTWSSSSSDHCSWPGVSCASNSRVVALNISGGGNSGSFSCAKVAQFPLYGFGIRRSCSNSNVKLVGKLSSALAKLTELSVLSLPFNELSGEIPEEIWGMENLEVLDLEGNLVTGSLPSELKGLKKLRVLNLGFNKVVGGIPSSLTNCVGLQVLNLAGNRMNGTIPGFIGEFRDLRGLYLSFNQLNGPIPSEIGQYCGNLEYLELAGNFLTEGIPRSLGSCRQLKSILLYSNMLEEGIPVELGQLNQLQVLDVSRNSLSGSIPSELGNCSKLSILVLSNLWDPLPSPSDSAVDASTAQLASTNDEYNFYEGTIPAEITGLSSLQMIWAPRATIEVKFPSGWSACTSLEMVNLGQNYYMGEITGVFSNCKSLRFLDLSLNKLTGELVEDLQVPCMNVFDVSENSLSGPLPRFKNSTCARLGHANRDPLELYDKSSAYLSFFTLRAMLETTLSLFGDGFGPAVVHNFGGNNFTGQLPSMPIAPETLGEQSAYAFLAGSNNFTGPFPENIIEQCHHMRSLIVNVSNNGLSGLVPTDIGSNCGSLKLFDVSKNQISGTIPQSVGHLVSLVSLNLSWNILQGQIPSTFGLMKDLKYLSLTGNKLSGSIPTSLQQLKSLEVLDLSSNLLSGQIPKDFVNLRNLTDLLLNNNNLSGEIPSGFVNVTTLRSFNVSFNNLSGPLPPNDQLGILGDSPSASTPPSTSSTQRKGNGGFNSIEIASITSAAVIVSVLIALIVLFFYTRKWSPRSRVAGSIRKEVTVFTDIGAPLTFEDVVQATGNFNASNCIGNGGFGATYKAQVAPGVLVAVKRLAVGRFQGRAKEFFTAGLWDSGPRDDLVEAYNEASRTATKATSTPILLAAAAFGC
nr:LRR receptor-like serine/threonine-protein kinase RPK2 [Ipomoea trifida]